MATFNFTKKREDYLKEANAQKAALEAYQKNKPGEYKSQYTDKINNTLSQIENRPKFTYDVNSDALYQAYKNNYINAGRMAMQDTIGQASALTGGYANSYAATAGNQAYQQYLTRLTDKIPELYQIAADRYGKEGNDLYNLYNLYNRADDTAYGRYRDTYNDYQTELARLTNMYQNEREYGTNLYNTDYGNAYNMYRANVADEQAAAEMAEKIRQYNENMAFQREQYEYQKQQEANELALAYAKLANSGGSGGGSQSTTTKTTTTVKSSGGNNKWLNDPAKKEKNTQTIIKALQNAQTDQKAQYILQKYADMGYDEETLRAAWKEYARTHQI